MTEQPSTPKIRDGPAGWSYKDWVGIVYPRRKPPHFHEAMFLSDTGKDCIVAPKSWIPFLMRNW